MSIETTTQRKPENPEVNKLPQPVALLEEIYEALSKPAMGSEELVGESKEMAKRLNAYWQQKFLQYKDIADTETTVKDGFWDIQASFDDGEELIGDNPQDVDDHFYATFTPDVNDTSRPPTLESLNVSFSYRVNSGKLVGYYIVDVKAGHIRRIERSYQSNGSSKEEKIVIAIPPQE